ncbi:hypothetical protein OUZ56_033292 [Daphnia magna]|uniref:Uncharacterized protein n=1 Tax=Daphnia magna TaxID=35525 RepID=A0ABR0BAJ4_9CRUS|nr:hypothetical protein OUZ56_033292 [Daphnia magna]
MELNTPKKRQQLSKENGLWLGRASKRKRKERTMERTEKEKIMQSDLERLEKEEDEEVWDNRKGKQVIRKITQRDSRKRRRKRRKIGQGNLKSEYEKEYDGRWDRGIGSQGTKQTDNETLKNEEEDEEERRKEKGKQEKEGRKLYNETAQNGVYDEEGRSKGMGKQRTPKVGEAKSEGPDNSESEYHQTSSSETEYETDEEVPREDEQAADDTQWENSKGKALRRTPPPTERLYPHLSEVEENEVVESKSEEELPEVDEEDKNQAELSQPKRKARKAHIKGQPPTRWSSRNKHKAQTQKSAEIKETKLMEEKDSATKGGGRKR